MTLRTLLISAVLSWGIVGLPFLQPPVHAWEMFQPAAWFDEHIQPVLQKCIVCHGAEEPEAGLTLSNASALTSGVIQPGDASASLLIERVTTPDADLRMPPEGPPLTETEIVALRDWIDHGAVWPSHWAYRPLTPPNLPRVAAHLKPWCRGPIDHFVAAKLTKHQLQPSAAANRQSLIRRVFYDLVGLPPTFEQTERFVRDTRADAYERLVDELLASPAYGERWARHWMDVVHFAETHGHDQDRPRENAWPYRDYLIRRFNQDLDYPTFIQEQIAGDVLYPQDPWALVGTGLLAAGPWDESSLRDIQADSIDRVKGQYVDRDDMVTTVMSTFASSSVHCARCHDHKFDPISQDDYYGLQAVFAGIDRANRPYDPDPELAERRATLENYRRQVVAWGELPFSQRIPPALRSSRICVSRVLTSLLDQEIAKLPPQRLVYCGTNQFAPDGSFRPTSVPREIQVLQRGEVSYPLRPAQPGSLSCVEDVPEFTIQFATIPGNREDEGRRRAALAVWLSHERNGLMWRSIANRLWQYHLGAPLVDTPNDFGFMGSLPSHPLLLEWLAARLRTQQGSLKALHREIVTSATYRQAVDHRPDAAATDSANRLLWRMNRRRMDAEQFRDSLLLISASLDHRMGGPSDQLFDQRPGVHVTPVVDYLGFDVTKRANHRRSVYRFLFRTLPDPFMEAMDCPDASQLAPRRSESITAIQALATLNDQFVLHQCSLLAELIEQTAETPDEQVVEVYRRVLRRMPRADELQSISPFLHDHGLTNVCRLLVNTSEFQFIE